jgi:hypothetical protein
MRTSHTHTNVGGVAPECGLAPLLGDVDLGGIILVDEGSSTGLHHALLGGTGGRAGGDGDGGGGGSTSGRGGDGSLGRQSNLVVGTVRIPNLHERIRRAGQCRGVGRSSSRLAQGKSLGDAARTRTADGDGGELGSGHRVDEVVLEGGVGDADVGGLVRAGEGGEFGGGDEGREGLGGDDGSGSGVEGLGRTADAELGTAGVELAGGNVQGNHLVPDEVVAYGELLGEGDGVRGAGGRRNSGCNRMVVRIRKKRRQIR